LAGCNPCSHPFLYADDTVSSPVVGDTVLTRISSFSASFSFALRPSGLSVRDLAVSYLFPIPPSPCSFNGTNLSLFAFFPRLLHFYSSRRGNPARTSEQIIWLLYPPDHFFSRLSSLTDYMGRPPVAVGITQVFPRQPPKSGAGRFWHSSIVERNVPLLDFCLQIVPTRNSKALRYWAPAG